MVESLFVLVGFGAFGGLVRALYGSLKTVLAGKTLLPAYFCLTVFVAAVLGGILGLVFVADGRLAVLVGYVGTDILENIFSSFIPKSLVVRK